MRPDRRERSSVPARHGVLPARTFVPWDDRQGKGLNASSTASSVPEETLMEARSFTVRDLRIESFASTKWGSALLRCSANVGTRGHMSFKEILVYIRHDGSEGSVTIAAQLAKQHRAYLTGLFALFGVAMLKLIRKQKTGFAKAFIAEEYATAAAAEKRFRDIATEAGIPHDWMAGEGNPIDLLNMFGRLQDLDVRTTAGPGRLRPDTILHPSSV